MTEIDLNENELRYGISALDLKHKDYAVNDELMVSGQNGEMFYKREDGQIVTSPGQKYNKNDLINSINEVFMTHNEVTVSDGDYIVYNTIDVAGGMNLISSETYTLGEESTFTTNKPSSGVFIRIRGNSATNSAMSYLQSKYMSSHSEVLPVVSVVLDVTELGTGINRKISMNTDFDTLDFVNLYPGISPTAECTGYQIKIESVKFPMVESAYNGLSDTEKSLLSELNYGNTRLEADSIDFIYYTSDVKDPIIYNETDRVKLNYVIPAKETNRDQFVISASQPSHKCMWAKVIE